MQRIIMHHTAGNLRPSAFDKQHYHRLVDGDGLVHMGVHPITANAPGRPLLSGRYAAHVARLNTGSIGVALAAMRNANWNNPRGCPAFPTKAQVDSLCVLVARLCIDHGIEVTRGTVLSHAEVSITLGVPQAGKWDFDYDPYGEVWSRDPIEIGDRLRAKISALAGDVVRKPSHDFPLIREGSRGEAVAIAQAALGVAIDGIFGPKTRSATLEFQVRHELVPDGIIGPATWSALNF